MSDPLWNLLQRAKESQLSSLGTTGLAVSIAAGLWLIRASIKLRREIKHKGWREVRKDWKSALKEGAIGVGLTAIVWFSLFAWNLHKVVVADYGELHSLKDQVATLQRERDILQKDNDDLTRKLTTKPTLVTKTIQVPAPDIKKQCWVAQHFGLPTSNKNGAVTATAVIMHCNYRIEAPYVAAVEFDRDFIPGGVDVPSAGSFQSGTDKQGKVFVVSIGAPTLPPEQVVILTVYGSTDQYPRPIRGEIRAQ